MLPRAYHPDGLEPVTKKWSTTTYAASFAIDSPLSFAHFSGYINYGISSTVPTLYQQVIATYYRLPTLRPVRLLPEFKKTFEIGLKLSNETAVLVNYLVSGAYFVNTYTDKFRTLQLIGSPECYFDNHSEAELTGLEGKVEGRFWQKRVSLYLAYITFFNLDALAFPFKPGQKLSLGGGFHHRLLDIDLVWFDEARCEGFAVTRQGYLQRLELPPFSNTDLHITARLPLKKRSVFMTFSGRNLTSDQRALEGIALRDKRIYVTTGVKL